MIIREATKDDAKAIAQVHVSSWQTSYRGIMPDEAIAARSIEQREAMWTRVLNNENRQSTILVAEDNDEIIGFVSGGQPQTIVDGYDGELYAIYLIAEAQGKGIGRQLTQQFAKRMHAAGYKTMLLSVLKNNDKSRGFYEKMGGRVIGTGEYRVTDAITLITLHYGWNDIRTLLAEG